MVRSAHGYHDERKRRGPDRGPRLFVTTGRDLHRPSARRAHARTAGEPWRGARSGCAWKSATPRPFISPPSRPEAISPRGPEDQRTARFSSGSLVLWVKPFCWTVSHPPDVPRLDHRLRVAL